MVKESGVFVLIVNFSGDLNLHDFTMLIRCYDRYFRLSVVTILKLNNNMTEFALLVYSVPYLWMFSRSLVYCVIVCTP